ncbi:MAG: hypothetical protein RLZZ303_2730, partial [Candidatus Hydrogenedentota bacterium]
PKRPWRAPARPGVSPVRAAPPSRLPQSGHLRMRPFARRDASDYAAGGECGDKYFLGKLNGVCRVYGFPEVTCPGPGLRRGDASCGAGRVPEQRAVQRFPKDGVLWREREGWPSHAKQLGEGGFAEFADVAHLRAQAIFLWRGRSAPQSEAESWRSSAWGPIAPQVTCGLSSASTKAACPRTYPASAMRKRAAPCHITVSLMGIFNSETASAKPPAHQ